MSIIKRLEWDDGCCSVDHRCQWSSLSMETKFNNLRCNQGELQYWGVIALCLLKWLDMNQVVYVTGIKLFIVQCCCVLLHEWAFYAMHSFLVKLTCKEASYVISCVSLTFAKEMHQIPHKETNTRLWCCCMISVMSSLLAQVLICMLGLRWVCENLSVAIIWAKLVAMDTRYYTISLRSLCDFTLSTFLGVFHT